VADLDVTRAGGATGALKRAAQLANMRAANANRVANALRRKQALERQRQNYNRQQRFADWGGGRVLPPPPKPRKLPPPPKMGPAQRDGQSARTDELLGLVDRPTDDYGNPNQRPGVKAPKKLIRDGYDAQGNPVDKFGNAIQGPGIERRTGNPTDEFGNLVQGPGLVGAPSFTDLTPAEQKKARETSKTIRETGKVTRTVNQMLESLKKDPLPDAERTLAGQELADAFRDQSKRKYFTMDDMVENPVLATLNELSAWSEYRIKVSEWKTKKNKSGTVGLEGDPGDPEEGGDGTFTGIVDNGSFSSVTSPSNLSPYLVTRDESGLLTVVTADQWIQAKFARMRHDPEYAAQMITALAMTSAYGSDSSANNQRSRVVVDRNGNPVKAFVSAEDLRALKELANQVAILQNQGDEVAIDDSIAELTAMAHEVGVQTTANGDYGDGGGGWGGGGWGGGGGYGGGGGGGQSVQLTDATELTSLVSSIARQRMGRELTPEEAALFVQHYHAKERQESANYYAGGEFTRLDPEGQAVAWITSHFEEEAARNQEGNLVATFMQMMGSTQFLPGVA
jgi:hypothetical protein